MGNFVMPETQKKIALVWDESGMDPLKFSVTQQLLNTEECSMFFDKCGIKLIHSSLSFNEAAYTHARQESLLVVPIGIELRDSQSVYLSHAGTFSTTSCCQNEVVSTTSFITSGTVTGTATNSLWTTSGHNSDLSIPDRSVLAIAHSLIPKYDQVAVLANDWALREQSRLEGVAVYGASSLLAGMVLLDGVDFSYQRGTSIYKKWMEHDQKWIPQCPHERRKMKFAEVLRIERQRQKDGKQFWKNRPISIL